MTQLDIKSAIAAHKDWANRLRLFVGGGAGDDKSIGNVRNYIHCILGQWLYGTETPHRLSQRYFELLGTHRRFHEVAGKIVKLHLDGRVRDAVSLLGGEFQTLSDKIVDLLGELENDGE